MSTDLSKLLADFHQDREKKKNAKVGAKVKMCYALKPMSTFVCNMKQHVPAAGSRTLKLAPTTTRGQRSKSSVDG